ncbi:unnamed protein product, partial [Didymodactylos carnosus]
LFYFKLQGNMAVSADVTKITLEESGSRLTENWFYYHPFLKEFITSGLSVSIANFATLPIDVLKVRLQLANSTVTSSKSAMKAGLIKTAHTIARKEGVRAFYSGLT